MTRRRFALAALLMLPGSVLAGSGHAVASVTASASASRPLSGKVVGIDPGHNGRNYSDPSYIDHPIWNGREHEACDTTGTETAGGYTEAQFNFNVAMYLAADLRAEGATGRPDPHDQRRRRTVRRHAVPRSSTGRTRTSRSTSTPTAARRRDGASRSSSRSRTDRTTA